MKIVVWQFFFFFFFFILLKLDGSLYILHSIFIVLLLVQKHFSQGKLPWRNTEFFFSLIQR